MTITVCLCPKTSLLFYLLLGCIISRTRSCKYMMFWPSPINEPFFFLYLLLCMSSLKSVSSKHRQPSGAFWCYISRQQMALAVWRLSPVIIHTSDPGMLAFTCFGYLKHVGWIVPHKEVCSGLTPVHVKMTLLGNTVFADVTKMGSYYIRWALVQPLVLIRRGKRGHRHMGEDEAESGWGAAS